MPGSSGDAAPGPAEANGDGDDGVYVDEEAVLRDWEALREDFDDPLDEERAFYCKILGGMWTAAHKLVPADAVVCMARAGLPRQWCVEYRWPKQCALYF